MTDRTDQEWLRLIKNNDSHAWNELSYMMGRWAKATIEGNLKTKENIEDAVSAARVQLMAVGIPSYRFEGSFLGFCRTLTVRECLGLVRKLNREPIQLDIDQTVLSSIMPIDPKAETSKIWERLKPCLDKLEKREKEIFLQIDYADVQPHIVAEQWKITRNHVNIIAWRVRREIKKCMEKQGYQNEEDVISL